VIVGIDARVPTFTGRGWGRYTLELVAALASMDGLQLRVLAPTGPGGRALVERVRPFGNVRVAVAPFEPASPDHYWSAAGGITLEKALGPVDLLHSPTRFILPTDSRPIVATVHDVAPLADPPFKPHYREATLRAIEFIREHDVRLLAISEFTRQELAARAGLDVRGVTVVHPGVSDVFFTMADDGRAPGQAYLLYVGGAGPNKNLTRLLAAVRLLREATPVDLVMAGDAAWDHAELAEALGPAPPSWIRLAGYVTDAELARLYRKAAACVCPSLHEGFGLPVLEAMASGTPLACSRIPVMQEVAGPAAVYFDPLDEADMAATLRALLSDPAACAGRVSRGRGRARGFTWTAAASGTVGVYRSARRGRGA
jgi:glycosyltransferase involved in cell wall biosynthesis